MFIIIKKDSRTLEKENAIIENQQRNRTYLKILPRMLTLLVNGHFLSIQLPSIADCGVLKPILSTMLTLQNQITLSTKANRVFFNREKLHLPSPIFLQYLTPVEVFLAWSFLELRNTPSCFWKALSVYIKTLSRHRRTHLNISHLRQQVIKISFAIK